MNLLIGDSHNACLTYLNNEKNIVTYFSASSIRGLINSNSKSGTNLKIQEIITKNKFNKLFIMFGKVDIKWVYYYKNNIKEININDFIDETIDKYYQYLNSIKEIFKEIYVMGLHLPSLSEEKMLSQLNKPKSFTSINSRIMNEVNTYKLITNIGSLEERTKIIILFNKKLKEKVEKEFNFIEITNELIDPITDTCKEIFVNPNDHHLRGNVGNVWYEKYLKLLLNE